MFINMLNVKYQMRWFRGSQINFRLLWFILAILVSNTGSLDADYKYVNALPEYWMQEGTEPVYIKWLGHASVKIWAANIVVYVDPRNLTESPHDATLVLVTHRHGDHYSPSDIAKVSGPETELISSADVIASEGSGQAITPGMTIESDGVNVTAVAAYNPSKTYHPKANNWVGFIIELGSNRIYCAGDTDLTDEMKALDDIDVAILPVGGTYTMNSVEAAEATKYIIPKLGIPYHWGDIIGSLSDAENFAELAQSPVKIMTVNEIISSRYWLEIPEELKGDLDNDKNIDLVDFSIFGSYWGKDNCQEPNRCAEADLAPEIPDGVVNFADLAVLCEYWLKTTWTPPLAGKAYGPNPTDGATGVDINADLSWTPGHLAESHDVYFGTTYPPPFVENQDTTTFNPGTMAEETIHYWRIDEINLAGKRTGEVWIFTTKNMGPPPK